MAWDTVAAIKATEAFEARLKQIEAKHPEAVTEVREALKETYRVAGLKAPARVIMGDSAQAACKSMAKYA